MIAIEINNLIEVKEKVNYVKMQVWDSKITYPWACYFFTPIIQIIRLPNLKTS